MDPYEVDLLKIPSTDLYADVPLYGRFRAKEGDLVPQNVSNTQVQYWESILDLCTPETRLLGPFEDVRDIFAVGGVIIHSAHLLPPEQRAKVVDHSFGDANDVAAAALVRSNWPEIPVPNYFFQGKLRGCDVLMQQRIEGVGLNVAWSYLSLSEKQAFKDQTRTIIQKLLSIIEPDRTKPSYIVEDPDPCTHRGIQRIEQELLFETSSSDQLGLSHNDLNPSNIIVDHGQIVGIVDWEMAGWFGRERSAKVHRKARIVDETSYANTEGISKEQLADLLFWHDLYDF